MFKCYYKNMFRELYTVVCDVTQCWRSSFWKHIHIRINIVYACTYTCIVLTLHANPICLDAN